MKVKTAIQWEKSEIDEWDDFFKPGDLIDEQAHDHMHEYVPVRFTSHRTETKRLPGVIFTQAGECETEIDGVRYYPTMAYYEDTKTYMYLGVLPAFKKPKY